MLRGFAVGGADTVGRSESAVGLAGQDDQLAGFAEEDDVRTVVGGEVGDAHGGDAVGDRNGFVAHVSAVWDFVALEVLFAGGGRRVRLGLKEELKATLASVPEREVGAAVGVEVGGFEQADAGMQLVDLHGAEAEVLGELGLLGLGERLFFGVERRGIQQTNRYQARTNHSGAPRESVKLCGKSWAL